MWINVKGTLQDVNHGEMGASEMIAALGLAGALGFWGAWLRCLDFSVLQGYRLWPVLSSNGFSECRDRRTPAGTCDFWTDGFRVQGSGRLVRTTHD